jgi:hypothetical protein
MDLDAETGFVVPAPLTHAPRLQESFREVDQDVGPVRVPFPGTLPNAATQSHQANSFSIAMLNSRSQRTPVEAQTWLEVAEKGDSPLLTVKSPY